MLTHEPLVRARTWKRTFHTRALGLQHQQQHYAWLHHAPTDTFVLGITTPALFEPADSWILPRTSAPDVGALLEEFPANAPILAATAAAAS